MPQNLEKLNSLHMMEIKTSYEQQIIKKEVASPPLGSPSHSHGEGGYESAAAMNPAAPESNLGPTLLQVRTSHLKQQQQIQQELLLKQYQQQQQQLAEVHQKQLQLHLNYLTQQAEEERSRHRLEEEKIEALRKKEKHEQSAVASTEVKQRLQDKILKKLRENDQNAVGGPSNVRNWPPGHILPAPEDFPLRKTASEPNICLKARLKQRMMERRSSPIVRRREKGAAQRRRQLAHTDSATTPDSGTSSPPNGAPPSRSSSSSTPIHEEGGGSPYGAPHHATPELSHPFSSLPNISLGRPPHSTQPEGSKLAIVSETEMVSAARSGIPITGHVLPSTLPNYPALPVLGSDACGIESAAVLRPHHFGTEMDTSGAVALSQVLYVLPPGPISETQQIRQAVLKRTGSKNHVENVEEETEAAVAEAIANNEKASQYLLKQVIDLTEKREISRYNALCANDRLSIFPQARDLCLKPQNIYSMGSPFAPRSGTHIARPLSRAQSSPLVTLSSTATHQEPISISKPGVTTGLAYDEVMQRHQCICGGNGPHPEHGGRIGAIWNRLNAKALSHRCHRIATRKATLDEIQSVHSEAHSVFFGANPIQRQNLDFRTLSEMPLKSFVKLPCGGIGVDSDTTWNDTTTSVAARTAVGCALDLSFKVMAGDLRNGYAIVRPPGHHAEFQQAMGFCFFNTVAISAMQLRTKLNLNKIMILDWDVHHGNGTQSTFYSDAHVLYLSMHRYDDGSFFPGTGAPSEVGEGEGYGFNVNVAWSGGLNPPMADAEYLAAFRAVVMPIAKEFCPDIILVSAGFDAASQHPHTLGGYKVSPSCFAHMTSSLMSLAMGKVVLVLEGGYELESICNASEACVRALLGDPLPPLQDIEVSRRPCRNAIEALQSVVAFQSPHWPILRRTASSIGLSHVEAKGREDEQETVSAMASLRVDQQANHNTSPEPATGPPTPNTNDEEEPMEQETQ